MSLKPPPPVVTCGCGRAFSLAAWLALPLVGYSDLYEDDDARCELRNCPCGSTRSRDVGPKPSAPRCMPCGAYVVGVAS